MVKFKIRPFYFVIDNVFFPQFLNRPVETEEKEIRSKRGSDTNKDEDECEIDRAKREDKSGDNDKKDAVNTDNKTGNGIILNRLVRRGMIRKRTTAKPNIGNQKTAKAH